MGRPRPYRKYLFRVDNKTVHEGITTDMARRDKELQQQWPKGHIKPVGGPVTEESARKWEKERGVS